VTLNASGTANKEVLIGSLGSNSLQGGAGGDTYVIGNTNATINNLPNCNTNGALSDCVKSSNASTFENDTVQLVPGYTEVIYIDRCLQVTASGGPGLGGNKIGTATKARATDADWGPISDQAGNCPTTVAAISNQSLRNLALGSHADLQAPWQRWWPASTAWNRAIGWLQQAITALIQGPHAVAQPEPTVRERVIRERVIRDLIPSDLRGTVTYPGIARLIQSSKGNFLRDGDRDLIVVDGSAKTFNGKPLSSISEVSQVYGQLNNKDEIPLNKGIALVYHQQIGLLASYGNDKYAYGTEKNPGTVIAHLVLPNGRALPATSIDSVQTVNLSRSPDTVPARRLVVPATPLGPTN
jgi:Ca2+-binding RTX toxin-like protein